MTAPLVSIVVPTLNGAATLPALFGAIETQRVSFTFEVVVVDSQSSDGTAEFVRSRAASFVSIDRAGFDHGLARNIGIEHSKGELIVLMVQDALPVSETWLAELTRPLFADEQLAAAYARQLPRADASAITRHYLERWSAASAAPRIQSIPSRASFDALDPGGRFELCVFDNVCSCIRRSVWNEHPFRATPIAEDVEWAREVLLAGYRIVYAPEARVVHSHERSSRYELARTYVLHRRLYDLFGLRTIPTVGSLARAIVSSLAIHARCSIRDRSRPRVVGRSLALAFAWPVGQYLGALSAMRGWKRSRSKIV
ncbi:MAG TPA: glycosyltransferase [Vicinamibacterales bacterium]